jgi:hypothetical protein
MSSVHNTQLEKANAGKGFLWLIQKEKDHKEDLDIGVRIILNLVLESCDVIVWTELFWNIELHKVLESWETEILKTYLAPWNYLVV